MKVGKKAIQQIEKKFQIKQHALAPSIRNSLDNHFQHAINLMNQIILGVYLKALNIIKFSITSKSHSQITSSLFLANV